MTDAQVVKRVLYWQKTLAILGISGWEVESITIVDEPTGGVDNRLAAATCNPSRFYDTVSFEFRRDHIPEGPESTEDFDKLIVHEWLHVAWRDLHNAALATEPFLGKPAWTIHYDRMEEEEEGLLDRFARLIVHLHA